jgi:hypothetical protein
MQTPEFPFVQIPSEMEDIIGKRDGPSHLYRKSGSEEECGVWFETLTELIGNSVSPGGVGMYCPVSRAAVHRRIKDGKLSMFLYHVVERKTSLFRRDRDERKSPFAYIPVSECKAWKKEFEDRAVSQEQISRQDLEGAKPDWTGEFMEWDSRWRKSQQEIGGPRDVPLTIKLSKLEIKGLEEAAATAGFDSKERFLIEWIEYVMAKGVSGISFMQLGMRIARLYEQTAVARKATAK